MHIGDDKTDSEKEADLVFNLDEEEGYPNDWWVIFRYRLSFFFFMDKQYQYFTKIIQRENKDKKDFIGWGRKICKFGHLKCKNIFGGDWLKGHASKMLFFVCQNDTECT